MKLIAIDTSGPVASVALAEDEKLIAGFRLQYKTTHSENLMPMLDLIRELTSLEMDTVDAIACASGPGSFTGLRIGAATAKGLADALEVPIVPVPTLEAIAYQMCGTQGLICPMLDARRQQVYTGVYRVYTDGKPGAADDTLPGVEVVKEGTALPVEEILAFLNEKAAETGERISLLGDGVPVYEDRIKEELNAPYFIVPFHRDRQSAEAVAALAFRYYAAGKAVDAAAFLPEYLRPSQAERVREENRSVKGENHE